MAIEFTSRGVNIKTILGQSLLSDICIIISVLIDADYFALRHILQQHYLFHSRPIHYYQFIVTVGSA